MLLPPDTPSLLTSYLPSLAEQIYFFRLLLSFSMTLTLRFPAFLFILPYALAAYPFRRSFSKLSNLHISFLLKVSGVSFPSLRPLQAACPPR